MGGQKHEQARLEGIYSYAQTIAEQAGAIEECRRHPGTFISQEDPEAEKMAYAIATNKLKEGGIDCNRDELMSAVKAAIDDAGIECYSCEKSERD